YWPWRAAGSPARDRRPGPRCRRARWRTLASSERLRASHHVRMIAWSSARSLVVGERLHEMIASLVPFRLSMRLGRLVFLVSVEFVQQVLEPIRNPLPYHVIVTPLKNVAESTLILAAEASSSLTYMGVRLHCRL